MKIEQLLDKRNSSNIALCMLNTPITGIKYNKTSFRGECECDCGYQDCDCDCNCTYCDCD